MALNLYRSHRRDCKAGRVEDFRTSDLEERKKGWKRCDCRIFASGTLGRGYRRKSTEQWEWDKARAVAAVREQAGTWEAELPPPMVEQAAPGRIMISDATKVFLSLRESAEIAPATLRKYRTFSKQLTAFAHSRGYVMLDQLTAADIDTFYAGWKLGVRAKGKRLGTLRAFFRFCTNRKWLHESPVGSDIKPPIGANRVANKAPFTAQELQRIIHACDKFAPVVWSNGRCVHHLSRLARQPPA